MNLQTALAPNKFREPADHRVTLNSLVEYEEIQVGMLHTVLLVAPKHADGSEGRISTFAPLGRALLGVRIGSIVDVPLADGSSTCVQVLAVRAQGDSDFTPA